MHFWLIGPVRTGYDLLGAQVIGYNFKVLSEISYGVHRFSHDLDNPAPRPPSSGPCWFCLSSPDVGTHLVVSVGEQCYCALAKGPIMQGHVLVLPIEHFPSTVSLPDDTIAEMRKYKNALRACYESQGSTIIVFERYIQLRAGTHAHLQVWLH